MFYEVRYQSMTACYGPQIIEADDEYSATRKFVGNSFSSGEMGCIKATLMSDKEVMGKLNS